MTRDRSGYGTSGNLYFVMLDISFPPTIRDRALYTGSMFRIAFESIYLVGLTSITVLTLFAASPSIGLGRHGTTSTRVVLFTAAGLHALLLGAAATSRYRFRRNKFRPRSALRALRGEIHDDIGLIGLVSLLAAAYALGPSIDTRSPIAVVAAVSPQVATWCILYFHGRTQHGETRALSPVVSVLLYGSGASLACLLAGLQVRSLATFNTATALALAAASLIPAILMAFRAHERALIASFRTQTTWMREQPATRCRVQPSEEGAVAPRKRAVYSPATKNSRLSLRKNRRFGTQSHGARDPKRATSRDASLHAHRSGQLCSRVADSRSAS